MSFKLLLNLNDLTEGKNSIPGENQVGYRDLWTGMFGDLTELSERINDETENAELLINWRRN